MVRILYAVTGSELGGASVHVLKLMKHFRQFHEVALLCAPESTMLQAVQAMGVPIYPNRYFQRSVNPLYDAIALGPVVRAIRDFHPDLVHAHSTKAGIATRLVAKSFRVKHTVFTVHSWPFTTGTPGWRKMLPLVERVMARFTDRFICVSEFERSLALRYRISSPRKLVVVYPGIETSEERPGRPSSDGPLEVIFVGRLAPPKDPLLLLKAVAKLNLDGKLRVKIVGDGELKEKAEQYKRDHGLQEIVSFTGTLPNDEVKQLLLRAHLLVLTSDWEGLPVSIMEAMAAGLPIVATRAGAVEELVEEGVNGFLVNRGDVNGLTSALGRLVDNRNLVQEMGYHSWRLARARFSTDAWFQGVGEVYQQLV